ncbi:MAG: hypothetical protein M3O62_08260 [Pseudomonadota bacterium]|nr:hypothetical protein [Pseudomonadota bacterium]
MRTFQTYRHPTQGFAAVKVGFSWPAFFFGGLWMLACSLWGKFGLWFLLYMAAAASEVALDAVADPLVYDAALFVLTVGYFALWLIPAFKGNAWRAANLLSRGYELSGTSDAANKNAAIAQVSAPAGMSQ